MEDINTVGIIISIFLVASILFGLVITIITSIYNLIANVSKPPKYYILVFSVSSVIGLILTGMVCGSMFL